MTIDPDKYIVMRKDKIHSDNYFPEYYFPADCFVTDAVVIRTQDRFAAAALETYASICSATAEMIAETHGENHPVYADLMGISDYFMGKALEAAHGRKKIPSV